MIAIVGGALNAAAAGAVVDADADADLNVNVAKPDKRLILQVNQLFARARAHTHARAHKNTHLLNKITYY